MSKKIYGGKMKKSSRQTANGMIEEVSLYIEKEALEQLSLYKGRKYIFKVVNMKEPDKFGYTKTLIADPYFHPECQEEGKPTYLTRQNGGNNDKRNVQGSDW